MLSIEYNEGSSGVSTHVENADLEALQKALTAGYGTDDAQLTGGGALRLQSLDRTLKATIASNQHFRMFNKLRKSKPTATVDEWTEQPDVGGWLGSTTIGEMSVLNQFTGTYLRRTAQVKYMSVQRQLSLVVSLQKGIADAEAREQMSGSIQLLQSAEFMCFEGNSGVVPTEYDGIASQIMAGVAQGAVDGGNIVDMQATSLSNITMINRAAASIAGFGNFGTPTDLFISQRVQADFDNNLDPSFRVALTNASDGGTKIGAPVTGIRTSHGNVDCNNDVFVRDPYQRQPFELTQPAQALIQSGLKPSVVTGTPASDVASMFGGGQAGNYYYLVTGVNAAGQSLGLISAQVAVAAGQSVSLSIAPSLSNSETGYVLYRSRRNGPGVVAGSIPNQGSDFREMCRVPRVATGNTVYVDQNRDIPGTCLAYMLAMSAMDDGIDWREYLPMFRFPLFATNQLILPWAQVMMGYLRITKRKQQVVFKNILPATAEWLPF